MALDYQRVHSFGDRIFVYFKHVKFVITHRAEFRDPVHKEHVPAHKGLYYVNL